MPLEKREIEIPLGAGGVSTGQDEKIIDAPKYLQLENCEISEFGSLEARTGYASQATDVVGVEAIAPVAIATRGNSRLAVNEGTDRHASVVEYSENASAWAGHQDLPGFLSAEAYTLVSNDRYNIIPTDTACNNGLLFIAFKDTLDDGFGIIIYDPATSTILSSIDDDYATPVFTSEVKLASAGDYVLGFYIDSDDDLQVRRIDSTDVDAGWSAATEINADCKQTYFDVHDDGTDAYVVCQSAAGLGNVWVFSIDEDLATTWSNTWASGAAAANDAIAIHKHETAAIICIVTADSGGVQINTVDSTDGSNDGSDTEAPTDVRNIIIGTDSSTFDYFLYLLERAGTVPEENYVETYRYQSATDNSSNFGSGTYRNYGLAHKFVGRSNASHVTDNLRWGMVRDTTYESQVHTFEYLFDLPYGYGKPAAKYARRLAYGETEQGYVPSVVENSDGSQAWFAFAGVTDVINVNGTITTKSNISIGSYNTDDNKRLNHVEAQNQTIFSGGWPTIWDGKYLNSLGLPHAPTIASVTSSAGVGGLENDGVYQYKAIYEYTDLHGQVWRSAPSVAEPITLGAADDTVDIIVRSMGDWMYNSTIERAIHKIYRTADAGTVFYLIAVENVNPVYFRQTNLTTIDTTADSVLTGRELLYTEGGVLENHPAPPFDHMVVHKNRLFVVNNETGDLAYSKEFLRGDGIHFNDALIIPTGSRVNRPIGLESMDENLILFWEDKIGVVYGDGPNDLGQQGTFTLPRIVAYTGLDPDDRRGLVKTPQGIFYKSKDGIKLLDRSMQVQDIGRDVIDLHTISGTDRPIVGAEHNQKKHQVMFTQGAGAGQAFVLVYDYLLKYWTKYIVNIEGTANAVGSDMWDDDHAIVADDGSNRIFKQTEGQYYDGAVSTADTIEMIARTNWIKLDGLQGYQRIWRGWLIGDYRGSHKLTVGCDFDYVQDGDSGSPYLMLDGVSHTVDPAPYQEKFGIPEKQKCEAISFYFKIEIVGTPPVNVGTPLAALTGLRLEYGVAPRGMRIKNTKQT